MAGKYWYELELFEATHSSNVQRWNCKEGRFKARRLAKEMSLENPSAELVINGYDLSETWRNGKCQTTTTRTQ